jgi:hypothetical protein
MENLFGRRERNGTTIYTTWASQAPRLLDRVVATDVPIIDTSVEPRAVHERRLNGHTFRQTTARGTLVCFRMKHQRQTVDDIRKEHFVRARDPVPDVQINGDQRMEDAPVRSTKILQKKKVNDNITTSWCTLPEAVSCVTISRTSCTISGDDISTGI